jgi:hypothetical protein
MYRKQTGSLDYTIAKTITTANLLTVHTCQLEKCEANLDSTWNNILKAHFTSVYQSEKQFKKTIYTLSFKSGDLILVYNSAIKTNLGQKTKPCYLRPMVVIYQCKGPLHNSNK